MEAQLAEGNLGQVGKYDVDFKEGKLCIEVTMSQSPVEAGLVIKLDAEGILDLIAKKVPGEVDDKVLMLVKQLLLKK